MEEHSSQTNKVPVLLDGRTASESANRNVGKIDVAASSVAVPNKHGVDCLGEICVTRLVDAASVYPEVAEAMFTWKRLCLSPDRLR
jgi:hypothetical protein